MADQDAQRAARTLRNLIEGADEVIFTTEGDPDDLVTAEAFAQLSEESIRRVDASAEEAQTIRLRYLEMGSPFGLFLRSFEREAHRYSYSPDGSEASEQSALIRVAGAQSVERKIHAALHPVVPMLAIRNPWDLMTRALVPRVSVADEEWEGLVERFAGEAFLIVFDCLALGAGVSIELELLRRCGRRGQHGCCARRPWRRRVVWDGAVRGHGPTRGRGADERPTEQGSSRARRFLTAWRTRARSIGSTSRRRSCSGT